MVIVRVVVSATLLVDAVTRPDTYRVQRTASINASPDMVFAYRTDLHS